MTLQWGRVGAPIGYLGVLCILQNAQTAVENGPF